MKLGRHVVSRVRTSLNVLRLFSIHVNVVLVLSDADVEAIERGCSDSRRPIKIVVLVLFQESLLVQSIQVQSS